MYLLADFAFVPMNGKKWDKVLNKWQLMTGENKIGMDRYDLLGGMRNKLKSRSKPKLEFLKKSYNDPVTDKKRKLVTGIAEIPQKDSKKVVVNSLVGNPKSELDPKFKGAVDSLDKKVGKRDIFIKGINDEVDDIYKKKFGDRLV